MVYGDRTLIDLTDDTVNPNSVLSGVTAHDRSGSVITGTIEERSSSNVTGSGGDTVNVAAGYYPTAVQKTAQELGISGGGVAADTAIIGSASEGQTFTATYVSRFLQGTLPELGADIEAHYVNSFTDGTAATATVSNGVLTISDGVNPSLSVTKVTIPNVISIGTLPSLDSESFSFKDISVEQVEVLVPSGT